MIVIIITIMVIIIYSSPSRIEPSEGGYTLSKCHSLALVKVCADSLSQYILHRGVANLNYYPA